VIKQEIRKEYIIKAKDIPISLHRANYATLSGDLKVKDSMLELNKFRYLPKFARRGRMRRQLFAQVQVGRGSTISRGFVTNSGAGPYMRRGDARLPIKKLLAIGAPIMASQPKVGPAASKRMGDTLAKRIDHEIKRVLSTAER